MKVEKKARRNRSKVPSTSQIKSSESNLLNPALEFRNALGERTGLNKLPVFSIPDEQTPRQGMRIQVSGWDNNKLMETIADFDLPGHLFNEFVELAGTENTTLSAILKRIVETRSSEEINHLRRCVLESENLLSLSADQLLAFVETLIPAIRNLLFRNRPMEKSAYDKFESGLQIQWGIIQDQIDDALMLLDRGCDDLEKLFPIVHASNPQSINETKAAA